MGFSDIANAKVAFARFRAVSSNWAPKRMGRILGISRLAISLMVVLSMYRGDYRLSNSACWRRADFTSCGRFAPHTMFMPWPIQIAARSVSTIPILGHINMPQYSGQDNACACCIDLPRRPKTVSGGKTARTRPRNQVSRRLSRPESPYSLRGGHFRTPV